MSAKKPPPRPPLPRMSTARRGQPTGIAPERSLRNPFSSISIRYSNSAKESDSDEEISIVRKETAEVSNQSNGCEGIEIEEDDSTKLTQIVIEPDGSANASRPDESRHVERNNYPCETSLKFPNKSLSTQELRQTPEKKTVTKQSTWPSYSRTSESETSSIMKFLRGREREQENEPKSDAPKEGISLPEKELKEETDVGSYPPKSNVDTGSDNNLKANEKRSRSPSPFRLLSRERQVENLSAGDQDKSKASSGISLSSLLASIGKDEVHSEVEEKAADIEENESNPDIVSEVPSSPELISSLNFCPGHFDEERSELSPHLLLRPVTDKSPQFSNFCLCCLVAYIYFVISWPPFVSGLVFGALIAYLNGCAFLWLFCPEDTAAERYHRALFEYRERIARTPKPVYKSVDTGLLLKRHKQEGWMFKSNDYVPDKFDFSSETVPVLASLKGTKLTLSHPKSDGTGKKFDPRSVEERKNTTVLFSRHEHYDIARSKVSLLPSTMSMKKVWSRKCPICVILEKPSAISEDVTYGNRSNDEDDFEVMHTMKQQNSSEEVGILYLFARTGREKEEWFNHLCKLLRDGNSESFGSSSSLKPVCSYPHYMAKLIQQPDKSPSQQSDIAWVNALVGRAFWDVWHDKYWTNKVKERFENKLAKMKKPSFIRDITISDLNLGESLPVITKAHPPVVDKQGTWVDVDVNYSGGLIFTFQGHLNVEGYLSFFLSLGNSEHEELEMAELSRKYEIIDKDSFTEEDEQNESESESPPDSDSDFESPESDFEEFTMKVPHVQLKQSTPNGKSEDGIQSENFDSLTLSSFEGNKEVQENREPLQSGSVSDSEGGEVSLEKNTKLKRQKLSSSKQSLNEETTEKSSVSPGPSEKMSESAPSSPLRTHLGLSTKHGPKHKIFSVIERLAKSKWVKKAAETGIVKRAAERFSNLPIILSVEVQSVQGTLALNIPPPPTNRLWYGFRGTPLLFVSARPKLGDRQVKLTHVTDWIEKKLKQEFRNMFVLPNMEDLPIRLMNSGLEEDFPEW